MLAPAAAFLLYMVINARNSEGLGYILGPAATVTAPLGLVMLLVDAVDSAIWQHDKRDLRIRPIPRT